MLIRNRLLILLLGIALLPLLGTALLHQGSVRLLRQRLTARTKESLDTTTREALRSLLESNASKFERDGRLNYQAIQRQALAIERRLATHPAPYEEPGVSGEFGRDTQLTVPTITHPLPPLAPSSPFLFQEQRYSLSASTHLADVRQDLARLSGMTSVYHNIYSNGARGILRLYTSLENGLHTSYPISDGHHLDPNAYDPRQQPWYQETIIAQDLTRRALTDATTGSATDTLAIPVFRPDGSLAGVTAIDRSISMMLNDFALPERWAIATKKRVVEVIPGTADQAGRLRILLWNDDGRPNENLLSPDRLQLQKLIADLQTGQPGTQRMSYRGEDSLWVYQSINLGRLAVVLIIPYTHVHDLAHEEEAIIDREIVSLLTLTGIGLTAAIAIATFLAYNRSSQITRPISELTRASHRLIGGDYQVRVHINTGDELEQLGDVFNRTGPALEERAQIKQSLELAGAIQQNLLPRTAPSVQGFDLAARCLYCDETGGDYYDFIDLRNEDSRLVGLAVGDVTGHGIGAALLMASIRSILHAESRHYRDDLVGLFNTMNNQIACDTDTDKFITLFYGLLNEADRSLVWASAGHDPALHWQAETGKIIEHPNTGMLMGLLEGVPYTQAGPVRLVPGDILLIGTDGIWEARNPQGEYFGRERLFDIVQSHAQQRADQLCETVLAQVTSFIANGPRLDDITLLVVKGQ